MTPEDRCRISQIEQELREAMEITGLAGLPGFPFDSLAAVKAANDSGAISPGTSYNPDLLNAFGSRKDIILSYVWAWLPFAVGLLFVVAAVVKGNYWYLAGVLSTGVGFLLSSPVFRGCAAVFLRLSWIPLVFFLWWSPVWAWVVAGLVAGYMFASAVRVQFRSVMVQRALESEVLFCYLYLKRVLLLSDANTGRFI